MKPVRGETGDRYDPNWYEHEMDFRFYTKMALRWMLRLAQREQSEAPKKESPGDG